VASKRCTLPGWRLERVWCSPSASIASNGIPAKLSQEMRPSSTVDFPTLPVLCVQAMNLRVTGGNSLGSVWLQVWPKRRLIGDWPWFIHERRVLQSFKMLQEIISRKFWCFKLFPLGRYRRRVVGQIGDSCVVTTRQHANSVVSQILAFAYFCVRPS
jgi:hypothetical protein